MANARKLLRFCGSITLLSLMGAMLTSAEVVDTAELPSTVEGLEAVPGDGEVTLTWDAATDDGGVEGYYVYAGLESVADGGNSYTFGSSDVGNTTKYTMDNLSNGVTYYFAVTAYDSEGNESEFYSKEVEATPESSEVADFTAPTVKSATALTSTLVEVVFSEGVELPTDPTTAFSLEATDGTALEVLDAYTADDASTVFVVTDVQDASSDYILTAGIGIEDDSGNPIESGTSDTATFEGSSLERETPTEEPDEPTKTENDDFQVDEVEATDINELVITFTQNVVSADADSFTIQQEDDASAEIDVLAVSVDEEDAKVITLVTEEMEPGFDYVLSMDDMIFNEEGETLSIQNRSVDFEAKTLDLADEIAPEDITNLISKALDEDSVKLTWTASLDSAGDLAEYLVYQSMDDGTSFGAAVKVAKDLTEYTKDGLTPGETYTFKVTAIDENGNESEGVLTTVTLPESGPELLVLGALSLMGAGVWTRKKKQL